MKRTILSIALILAFGFSLTSCRENKKGEDINITIEESVDEAAEETEGALEKTGREIDEAVKEVKEAGEAAADVVDDDN